MEENEQKVVVNEESDNTTDVTKDVLQRIPLSGEKPFPVNELGQPTDEYRKTLLKLTLLEFKLRKRATNNLRRRGNLLIRINSARRKLNMQEMTLKDFL